MSILRFANTTESVSVLWNNQEMNWGNWVDVSKSESYLIFIKNISGYLLANNSIKYGYFLGLGSLGLRLFVAHLLN